MINHKNKTNTTTTTTSGDKEEDCDMTNYTKDAKNAIEINNIPSTTSTSSTSIPFFGQAEAITSADLGLPTTSQNHHPNPNDNDNNAEVAGCCASTKGNPTTVDVDACNKTLDLDVRDDDDDGDDEYKLDKYNHSDNDNGSSLTNLEFQIQSAFVSSGCDCSWCDRDSLLPIVASCASSSTPEATAYRNCALSSTNSSSDKATKVTTETEDCYQDSGVNSYTRAAQAFLSSYSNLEQLRVTRNTGLKLYPLPLGLNRGLGSILRDGSKKGDSRSRRIKEGSSTGEGISLVELLGLVSEARFQKRFISVQREDHGSWEDYNSGITLGKNSWQRNSLSDPLRNRLWSKGGYFYNLIGGFQTGTLPRITNSGYLFCHLKDPCRFQLTSSPKAHSRRTKLVDRREPRQFLESLDRQLRSHSPLPLREISGLASGIMGPLKRSTIISEPVDHDITPDRSSHSHNHHSFYERYPEVFHKDPGTTFKHGRSPSSQKHKDQEDERTVMLRRKQRTRKENQDDHHIYGHDYDVYGSDGNTDSDNDNHQINPWEERPSITDIRIIIGTDSLPHLSHSQNRKIRWTSSVVNNVIGSGTKTTTSSHSIKRRGGGLNEYFDQMNSDNNDLADDQEKLFRKTVTFSPETIFIERDMDTPFWQDFTERRRRRQILRQQKKRKKSPHQVRIAFIEHFKFLGHGRSSKSKNDTAVGKDGLSKSTSGRSTLDRHLSLAKNNNNYLEEFGSSGCGDGDSKEDDEHRKKGPAGGNKICKVFSCSWCFRQTEPD